MEFFAKDGKLFQNTKEIQLKGINWLGGEGECFSPHALWAKKLEKLIMLIKNYNFNAVRLTLSTKVMLELDKLHVSNVDSTKNPGLDKYTAGQLLDLVVTKLRDIGVLVMFNMHSMKPNQYVPELWYTKEYPENKVIEAWKVIAKRYINSPNVFAMDIKNKPHGKSSWGGNDPSVDWASACERIGNAIHSVNPKLLICVEGITSKIWGDTIDGAQKRPIILKIPNKVILSPHCYKHWHYPNASNFNNQQYLDSCFGNIIKSGKTTVVIGEYGYNHEDDLDLQWADDFANYLNKLGVRNAFYWCLNANSTGNQGLLKDDWSSIIDSKLSLINKISPTPTIFSFSSILPPIPHAPQQPTPQKPAPQKPAPQKPTPEKPQPPNPQEPQKTPKVEIRIKQKNKWSEANKVVYQQEVVLINTSMEKIKNVVLQLQNTNIISTYSTTQQGNMVSFPDWLKTNKLGPQQSWVFGYNSYDAIGKIVVVQVEH